MKLYPDQNHKMPENKFYVYIHLKSDDNSVFYIGKGKGSRYKSRSGRSKHWKNTVKKHGYYCMIHGFFDIESEAYEEEIKLIRKLRKDGVKLVNIANGGEGGLSGTKLTKEHILKLRNAKHGKPQLPYHAAKSAVAKLGKKQPRSAVDYVIGLKKKKIINSNGDVFSSCSDAARYYESKGNGFCQGIIASCARGYRPTALGVTWSYDISKVPELIEKKENKKRISNGVMEVDSAKDAVNWLVERGFTNAVRQSVSHSARNKGKKAYGYQWEYI